MPKTTIEELNGNAFPENKLHCEDPMERQILANGLLVHDDLHFSLQGCCMPSRK